MNVKKLVEDLEESKSDDSSYTNECIDDIIVELKLSAEYKKEAKNGS